MLSIDPGGSTGIALGTFSETEPYALVETWQPRGGAVGFLEWAVDTDWFAPLDVIVAEQFILRSAEKDNRVPNVEPIRIEGVMLALRWDVQYQSRTMKSMVKDQVLKDHGLWQTGKKFGHTDGRDANDAIIHALAHLKNKRHLPSLRKYWGPNGDVRDSTA